MYFIQSYGTDDQSYRCVIEKVHESFPNIQVSRMGVQKLIKKFLTTGSVKNLNRKNRTMKTTLLLFWCWNLCRINQNPH
jgi:hypothetical protein